MAPDPESPSDEAARLVAEMTLEEKAGLTSGADFWHTKGVERLGLAPIMMTDGPHGLRKQMDDPGLTGLDKSIPATCFPTAAALGSTWDPDLLRRVGTALGEEARANQVAVLLGPGLNMKRSPLCGRNFEYLSEDPLVAGVAGAALVEGIQSVGEGTSLKHFAANNQETDRMRVSADVDERVLREIYLAAFEHIVKHAHPWTLMCSYNRINGVYSSENPWLLTSVLREEWGFEGLVMSDWGAVDERIAGLIAGLDLEMPSSGGGTDAQIVAAIREGNLDEKVLDQAAIRVTTMLIRARDARPEHGHFEFPVHHRLAREAAVAGSVLLRNEPGEQGPMLPLRIGDYDEENRLVVIGEFARTPRYQGSGSSRINPIRLGDALTGLEDLLGSHVGFEPGFHLLEAEEEPGQELSAEELVNNAVEAARDRDVVLFAGLPAEDESEGYDRTTIDLPAEQISLIHKVAAVARRTAVLLSNGSVVRLSDWEDEVDAVLECWLGGQAGGAAMVQLLFGYQSPSGHLAESIPRELPQVPAQLNFPGADGHVQYGEGIFIGYRGLDAMAQPVSHPFGFGLTYTTFVIDEITAPDSVVIEEDTPQDAVVATVSAHITNTGSRHGAQVVQLYLGRTGDSRIARAPRELRGFVTVDLNRGESAPIAFPVTRRDFSHWDTASHSWIVEPGSWEFAVGTSSRDFDAQLPVDVEAPPLSHRLGPDSTLAEWLEDPLGAPQLDDPALGIADLLADAGTSAMMGSVPMIRLLRMNSLDDPDTVLKGMLDRLE